MKPAVRWSVERRAFVHRRREADEQQSEHLDAIDVVRRRAREHVCRRDTLGPHVGERQHGVALLSQLRQRRRRRGKLVDREARQEEHRHDRVEQRDGERRDSVRAQAERRRLVGRSAIVPEDLIRQARVLVLERDRNDARQQTNARNRLARRLVERGVLAVCARE